jgi:hypothetical protein
MRENVVRLSLVLTLLLAAAAPSFATGVDELLKRHAPVFVQHCSGRADYITKFDYDGNWAGADNWENFDKNVALPAVAYTSSIETTTHWYLVYSYFHPRDWWKISLPILNHENDLEGVLVVLEKREGAEPEPVVMETISHFDIKRYSNVLKGDELDGPIRLEGTHPIVQAEAYKHGITGWNGKDLAKEDGVIYRYKGKAEQPATNDDRDVGYDFVSLKDTFWARRNEVGPGKMYGESAEYAQGTFGAKIAGDNHGKNKASAPWAWSDKDDKGLAPGDWFFQPARAMHVHFPKNKARFSSEYVSNEFLMEGATARDMERSRLFERAAID